MVPMNRSPDPLPAKFFLLDPAVLGTACCVASALCYTAANICLRKLAQLEVDETWVICIKEVVTVAVVGPWLLAQAARGRSVIPARRALVALVFVGLAVQVAGNLPVQWALGVLGIAVTVPVIFGVMLTASALLGLTLLREKVSLRSAVAIGLLVLAIVLLSAGATSSDPSTAGSEDASGSGPLKVILAVAGACLGGAMFALLSTTIRFVATARVPVTSIVFVITGMGVLSMSTLSLWRLGPEQLLATTPEQLAWMIAAGTCNLIAFLAITKGLQLTTVVHANVLNATQVAMGALAGIMLFDESLSLWATLGICLMIVGIVFYGRPEADEPEMQAV